VTGLRLEASKDAELVALWVGHDHPALLPLPDVDPAGSQADEPVDLFVLCAVDGTGV
jgi:hypothetical protein